MTAQDDNRCLNCQATLTGPYCSQCGQARSARLVPFVDWAGEFLETCCNLDSKFLRTLKRILLQPGQATVDFAAGRRVPYTGPARVYIIVSAFSIAAMTLQGAFAPNSGMVIPGLNPDPDFQKTVQFLFPFVNLLSPFLTATILAIYQRKTFFQLHLAFSLHFWTFLIAAGTPLIYIPPISLWSLAAFAGLSLISAGYLFIAHRRVYAMPLLHRLVAWVLVLCSVPFATILFTLLLFLLAFALS
jgi:hypothetical protein